MLLGGLQRHSLIDYPGKISCVCFITGCNFRCPYCHNPDLVRGRRVTPQPLDEGALSEFLERRKGFLEGVVISGGEPTLERGLAPLCRKIKRLGYSIKMDTNGSRPWVIKSLIDEGLVDYIAMDIKTELTLYPWFTQGKCSADTIHSSIQIIMESGLDYEFRTTCVRPIVDNRTVENIARLIQGARTFALQQFHNVEILQPEYFRGFKAGYDDDEMMRLKSAAEPFVRACVVRQSLTSADYLKAA